jgi:hypothetical protein
MLRRVSQSRPAHQLFDPGREKLGVSPGMKTTSTDRTCIDYWQDYGTGLKSHFGIRVWADHCSAITNVGAQQPKLFGGPGTLPINMSGTEGQHSLNSVISEHMRRHPDSDLVAVLTGKKSFKEALD